MVSKSQAVGLREKGACPAVRGKLNVNNTELIWPL